MKTTIGGTINVQDDSHGNRGVEYRQESSGSFRLDGRGRRSDGDGTRLRVGDGNRHRGRRKESRGRRRYGRRGDYSGDSYGAGRTAGRRYHHTQGRRAHPSFCLIISNTSAVRVITLAALFLCLFSVGTANAGEYSKISSAERLGKWVQLLSDRPGGSPSPAGWYEYVEPGGEHNGELMWKGNFGNDSEIYPPDQYKSIGNSLDGYAGVAGENDTAANMEKIVQNDSTAGDETSGEVNNSVSIIERSREAGTSLPVGVAEELDSAANDGGSLGIDLGAATEGGLLGGGGALAAGLSSLGAVALGPLAFDLGIDIGNGLDEDFGLPTWNKYKEEEEAKHSGSTEGFLLEQCGGEAACQKQPGLYLECRGDEYKEDLTYSAYGGHPAEKVDYGCAGSGNVVVDDPCKSERCSEPGYLQDDRHEFDKVCVEPEETEKPLVKNCAGPEKIQGVPNIAPPDSERLLNDSTVGVEPVPPGEVEPRFRVKKDSLKKHISNQQEMELLAPEEGDPGYEDEPGQLTKPSEEDLNKEAEEGNKTENEPLAKAYPEMTPSTSPDEEGKTETTTEPEGPGAIGPPALPGFKIAAFGVLCKGFPFGVPCWLIKTIESWSAGGSCPQWGIEEFDIKGVKIKGHNFDLCELEPIMEKARPAMLIFITIGLVLLFYNFAKGGSPPSGGGTPDTGGGGKDGDFYKEYNDEHGFTH